jgi:hypothetical protein
VGRENSMRSYDPMGNSEVFPSHCSVMLYFMGYVPCRIAEYFLVGNLTHTHTFLSYNVIEQKPEIIVLSVNEFWGEKQIATPGDSNRDF